MANRPQPDHDHEHERSSNGLSTWDEVRRMADDLELEIHLARLSAREQWRLLEPRLIALEKRITSSSEQPDEQALHELAELRALLQSLHHEVLDTN